jgi:hypothetical protein
MTWVTITIARAMCKVYLQVRRSPPSMQTPKNSFLGATWHEKVTRYTKQDFLDLQYVLESFQPKNNKKKQSFQPKKEKTKKKKECT